MNISTKTKLLTAFSILIVIAFLVLNFLSEKGFSNYLVLRKNHQRILKNNQQIQNDNLILAKEIRMMKENRKFREKIIRNELGFIKDNELILVVDR